MNNAQQQNLSRRNRLRQYLRGVVRGAAEFKSSRRFWHYQVWRRDCDCRALRALLRNPDAAIAGGEMLKDDARTTVASVRGNGRNWVIKRYNLPSWSYAVSRMLRPSRAWRVWLSSHRLQFYSIPTPMAIAVYEKRWGPLRRQAYFISEQVAGPSLAHVLHSPATADIIQQVVNIFYNLAVNRLSHGDTKAHNWLVTTHGVNLIDLDAMRQHRFGVWHRRALRRDLARFLRNWPEGSKQDFAHALRFIANWLEGRVKTLSQTP